MIVAVTGGTGFIGKKLISRLIERGDTVRLLTRGAKKSEETPLLKTYTLDLVRAKSNDFLPFLDGVEILYHCAGQLTEENTMHALHVSATRTLVDAASRQIGHWVQLSSVGVYGSVRKGLITEDTPLNPVGQYEKTKGISDKIVVDAAANGKFTYSILRPSNVFGAGMSNQSLLNMIAIIDRGLFFYIGKPGAVASYIHVDNVVEALIRCGTMSNAKGRVYTLSDHCTMERFVEIIADALDHSSPRLRISEPIAHLIVVALGKIPGFPLTQTRVLALTNRSFYSIARIQNELGYTHRISLEDGLRELVAAYNRSNYAHQR